MPAPYPVLQVGKVLGIHRHGHTIDVYLLHGGTILEDVPVVGWGGTIFGTAGLMASNSDRYVLGKKVYPPENHANLLYPAANTEMTRDVYAVIAQIEGSQRGVAGAVALGFMYPPVSEMHFPGDLFPDFWLFRHPSDFQHTIDRYGSFSLQHPTGARITMENMLPAEEFAEGEEGGEEGEEGGEENGGGLPDLPDIPGLPDLPDIPGLPGPFAKTPPKKRPVPATILPDLPDIPGMPDIPGFPGGGNGESGGGPPGAPEFPMRPEGEAGAPPGLVNLAGRDQHERYQLRANIPAYLAVNQREPAIYVRIPKLFLIPWEIEEVARGVVMDWVHPNDPTEVWVPSAAAFPVSTGDLELPEPSDLMTALVINISGEKSRVARTARLPGGLLALVISPPLVSGPPAVGSEYLIEKIPIREVGNVFVWEEEKGNLREEAYWEEPLEPAFEGAPEEVVIRGEFYERSGMLHDKLVEAGDIFETAHPAEEAGGNIINRADINHLTTAGEVNRMENDAGVSLTMNMDGSAVFLAPGDIWITAGGILHLDGAMILENMGGAGEGEAEGEDGDGEDFGGLFPFDIPFISGMGGNTGFKIPGLGGGGIPGVSKIPVIGKMFGGKGKGGGLFPFDLF